MTTHRIGGLTPNTRYYVRVTQKGGVHDGTALEGSTYTAPTTGQRISFAPCDPIPLYHGVQDRLEAGCESRLRDRGGVFAKNYSFSIREARAIVLTAKSPEVDSHLYLLRGSDPAAAYEIGEGADIDTEARNLNARVIKGVTAGDYTVQMTSYAAGETGAFTLKLQDYAEGYPTPPSDPFPGFYPAAVYGDDWDAEEAEDEAIAQAVSAEGLVTWELGESPVSGQVYLLRWASGGSPPQSAASKDAPGYRTGWIAASGCGPDSCQFRIPGFDPELHYLVQVRRLHGNGDNGWQSARYSPS